MVSLDFGAVGEGISVLVTGVACTPVLLTGIVCTRVTRAHSSLGMVCISYNWCYLHWFWLVWHVSEWRKSTGVGVRAQQWGQG